MVETTDDDTLHLTNHGFSNKLEEGRIKLMARPAREPHVLANAEGIFTRDARLCSRAEHCLGIKKNK